MWEEASEIGEDDSGVAEEDAVENDVGEIEAVDLVLGEVRAPT